MTPYDLVKRWNIGLETAKQTLLKTTQRGLRTSPNPSLSQWYSTNDRMFRYRRLHIVLFTGTLEVGIISYRGNRYAQIYAHRNTWCKAFPMAKKSDAHETLSLLFAQEGVSSTLVMDGAREQVMGEFRLKARQADCHEKQTEPYSPWQNAAESSIRELKKGTGRKIIKSNSPKKLWDDCIELEMEIRSCTTKNVFELKGEVPRIVMKGETANITHLFEFGWYDWVYIRDNAVTYPNDKLVLGRWLGPSTDIGPALCAKILKENGRCVCRSSYRHLSEHEVNSPVERKKRESYDQMIYQDWDHQQAHRTLKRITQLLNMSCMKMMMGMELPMLRNAMMNQLPSHMTHTLVLR